MIERIKTNGYLGPNIDQKCGPKVVFVGPNRSGKTTRMIAIHLVLNGFVATGHKVTKKAGELLNQYSNGDRLTSEITINGHEFEHHIFRIESGKVSTRYRIDKAVYPKKEFYEELVKNGNPKVIDLSNFIEMSDNKKIDTLFKIYPSGVDIGKLNKGIATQTAQKNKYDADIKLKKAVIRENTKAKKDINVPAGSLAEIQEEIEKTTDDYQECRDKITKLKTELEQKEKKGSDDDSTTSFKFGDFKEPGSVVDADFFPNTSPSVSPDDPVKVAESTLMKELNRHPIDSLNRVLEVTKDAGCEVCVVAMVIKQEIKKYSRND